MTDDDSTTDYDKWRRRNRNQDQAAGPLDLSAVPPTVLRAVARSIAERTVVDYEIKYECNGCGRMLARAYRYVGSDSEAREVRPPCACSGRPVVPSQQDHDAAVRRALARPRDPDRRFDGRTATIRVRRTGLIS